MRAIRSSLTLLMAAAACAQTQNEPASLSGDVTHTVTGAPILRAHITLRGNAPNGATYGALTNAEGKFAITGIPAGIYQATVERIGFFLPPLPGNRTTVEVNLRAAEKKEDLKFRLAPLGSISGRVVDAKGEPVEGVAVTIDAGQGYSPIRDTTDDQGRYRLVGLQPGKHKVRANVGGLPTPPEVRSDGTTEIRYAPTWYPGAATYREGVRVELVAGAEVSGIDIPLVRIPMVRISGKVFDFPPEVRTATLSFAQTTGSRGSGNVKRDGTFEVWNIDPGKYFLTASWQGTGNQRVQTAPIDIEIGQQHIDRLELRLVPPSDIAGTIIYEDEGARPPAPQQAGQQGSQAPRQVLTVPQPPPPPGTPQSAQRPPDNRAPRVEVRTVDPGIYGTSSAISDVAADGSFRLNGVPAARFRVMPTWQNAYVKSVTLGDTQRDGNVLYLRNGSAGAALTVLLSSAFGSVSGTVADQSGPVNGARVALLRDDFVSLGDVTFTNTDATGAYNYQNVRPGKYRLAVVEEYDLAPRAGNLDDYEDILVHVDVQPKDKVTKDLKRHK
ncbi:MAG: carboxypeptidase-like regulatory domain-containing protein [Candidatus Solibacter sp.]